MDFKITCNNCGIMIVEYYHDDYKEKGENTLILEWIFL